MSTPNPFEKPTSLTFNSDMTVAVFDPAGVAPVTIIQRDDPWKIQAKLHMDGGATSYLGGTLKVEAYLESIGGGFEGKVGPTEEIALNYSDPQECTVEIEIPPAVDLGAEAGAYKLMTVMTYVKGSGLPGEIACFAEGPVVQLYDPA
jgi:hypothetical protein